MSTTPKFVPLATELVRRLQADGLDASGQVPERSISDGIGVPCRHCLNTVPAGKTYLVVAHRPFTSVQPYAEVGPIFLCADACVAWSMSEAPPGILTSKEYIVRGYSPDERIAYGSGKVTRPIRSSTTAAASSTTPQYPSFTSARRPTIAIRFGSKGRRKRHDVPGIGQAHRPLRRL